MKTSIVTGTQSRASRNPHASHRFARVFRPAFASFFTLTLMSAFFFTLAPPAECARPFIAGGRLLTIDRPFRPGPGINAEYGAARVAPSAPTETRILTSRVEPVKGPSVIESVSPPRVVPHYLPKEGDYTPHHYKGVTVVAIPPQSSYVPNPLTGEVPAMSRAGAYSSLPPTIPGPRQVTPLGLRPGTDPFRPSPFDPDVTRRQGYKRF